MREHANGHADAGRSAALIAHLDDFACPCCGETLQASGAGVLTCVTRGHRFPSDNGIPLLFWPNEWVHGARDVTPVVKAFYEQTPFPDYEDLDSVAGLRSKARQGFFARWLDEQIGYRAKILEAGCGTGQLSNFLATVRGRTVYGADMSLPSLRLAENFRADNEIERVTFLQMNLFRPPFKPARFDVVICNGVLHHTSDPFGGFRAILRLVRPGGHIVIGLYNRYGRVATQVRGAILRLIGDRAAAIDPLLRTTHRGNRRRHAWLMDQYRNPHESTHTIGEVLGWFRKTGVAFVMGIPKPRAFDPLSANEQLFDKHAHGSRLDHALVQTGMLVTGGKEGGFFITIGRKE